MKPSRTSMPRLDPPPESVVIMPILTGSAFAPADATSAVPSSTPIHALLVTGPSSDCSLAAKTL